MSTDDMLRAIYDLKLADGISYSEMSDITTWAERAAPNWDTTILSEKSRERIQAIYNRFYEARP